MSRSSISDILSGLLQPSPTVLLATVLIAVLVPLFLHLVIYRTPGSATLPSFLLVGPSGSGKTSLLTLFERGSPASTRTSQTLATVEASVPASTKTTSSRYRSANDPSNTEHKKFLVIDTPGHGKLRHYAVTSLTKPQNLKGLIFVVDAANLNAESAGLREAAEYLHDVLLFLQKRALSSGGRALKGIPVLIAANKLDLFTALPAGMVKKALEQEITNIRASKSKGLLDSGIGMNDVGDPEKDWLGEGGEGEFQFSQLQEFDIEVATHGGVVSSPDGSDIEKWWQWIGECL